MNIITIDLGTTVCKVRSYDESGEILGEYSEEMPTNHPNPGWAEQDPEKWWEVIVRGVSRCHRGAGDIGSIGICSHRESILAVDEDGNVIQPCILWADRRCENEARELGATFGPDIHQVTGMKPDPYFTAPKLLWLKKNRPEILRKTSKFLLPKDYLVYKLTGKFSTDWTVASRTMLLRIRDGAWWEEMLDIVGVTREQMCDPVDSASVVGELTDKVKGLLNLEGRIEVIAGAGDRQCEALGSGVTRTRAMESTGSATNISISTEELPPELSNGLLYSCHAEVGYFLVEQGIGSTGLALNWFRDTFHPPMKERGRDPYEVIDREASRSSPGANGVTFLPFLMGAQATRWNPDARGVLFGMRLGHSYGDIARAVLEGIAYEIRAAIGVFAGEGLDPEIILALGGSAKSEVWNRIKADITKRTYSRPRVSSAASLGAMILGCRGCEIDPPDVGILNPIEDRFTPDPAMGSLYDEAFEKYERVYEACKSVF